jgi:hypothetical protein
MIAWFMIAIGTVAFFAYIAISGVQTVEATSTMSGRAETVRRIENVVTALTARSSALQGDGIVYAPAGVPASGEYLLPRDLQAAGITSWGTRFQYCPMGLPLDTTNGTVSYPGGSYQIRTAALNDREFVVSGRLGTAAAADPNVIALVMAPIAPTSAPAGCGQITRSGELYTAPGYIVRAIRRSAIADVDANRVADGATWFVSPSGNGDGRSWSTAASFNSALAAYRSSLGGTFTIRLASGSYSLDAPALDQTRTTMASKKDASTLLLIGSGAATIGGATSIYVPSNLELRNINASGLAVAVDDGNYLRITDSTMGAVTVGGRGRLQTSGTVILIPTNNDPYTINVVGGGSAVLNNALNLYYNANRPVMNIEGGSNVVMAAATVNVSPATQAASSAGMQAGFVEDTTSSLTLKTATVNIDATTTWAFLAQGRFTVYNSSINFNRYTWVGVQTGKSAQITMWSSNLRGTNPPQYTIASQGTTSMVGNANLWSGNRCWYRGDGSIFRLSLLGIPNQTSAVSNNEPDTFMAAQPTAQQVVDLQAVRARNIEREEIRNKMSNMTSPGFTCNQAAPVEWVNCAIENGYCSLPEYTTVRYGANGAYRSREIARGIECNNANFGDPIVGTVKSCQYAR